MRLLLPTILFCTLLPPLLAADAPRSGARQQFLSAPPLRPLPLASKRPLGNGPAYFVNAEKGDDKSAGSKQSPWRTIGHALSRLQPGDTLYLRGGTFYESVTVKQAGKPDKPLTMRAFPGELAIIDAGYREFFENPAKSWEPYERGVAGEYRSTKAYKRGGGFGAFDGSMIPFQRYLTFHDLRRCFLNRLCEANQPLDVAIALTGHRSMETVMKHYRDPSARAQRQALDAIGDV